MVSGSASIVCTCAVDGALTTGLIANDGGGIKIKLPHTGVPWNLSGMEMSGHGGSDLSSVLPITSVS